MKQFILAAAVSLAATSAMAGALTDPIVEADIIMEETSASSVDHGILVPIMMLVLLTATLFSPAKHP